MHVLLAAHALPPDAVGGTELYTVRLAETFAARGHDVTVAARRGTGASIDGATTVALPGPTPTDRPEDGVAFAADAGVVQPEIDAAMADLFDDCDPDLVHLQHLKGLSAGIPPVCTDRGIPCVLTLHDFWTRCHREQLRKPDGTRCSGPTSVEKCVDCYAAAVAPFVRRSTTEDDGATEAATADPYGLDSVAAEPVARRTRRLERAVAACDRLISPSRYLRGVFVEYGTEPDRIVHLRNGIRTERFRSSSFDADGPLTVGYAGRIAESKGVHVLLEAVERLPDAAVELDVHGRFRPDENAYHARLRAAAGGDDRIRFRGRYDDAADVFPDFDAFVLPSVWVENSPLVIQEAFAAGVPVVTGDRGGMAELVDDGVDGLTVPVGDADALAAALRRLAIDPALVRRLRAGVEEPTRLAEHATDLFSLYREHVPSTSNDGSDERTGDVRFERTDDGHGDRSGDGRGEKTSAGERPADRA